MKGGGSLRFSEFIHVPVESGCFFGEFLSKELSRLVMKEDFKNAIQLLMLFCFHPLASSGYEISCGAKPPQIQ